MSPAGPIACLLLGLAACAAPAGGAGPGPAPAALPAPARDTIAGSVIYAALPPRNLTTDAQAPDGILGLLQATLEARGARFVPADEVEQLLRRRRIRYTDSISPAGAQAFADETGATHVLLMSVLASHGGADPRLGVALRVVDTSAGRRQASRFVALDGLDFEGLLGLGTIHRADELQEEVVARLLAGFDAAGAPSGPAAGREELVPPAPEDPTTFFLRPDFDLSAAGRIAVLPLANRTRRIDSGLVFAELLGHWFSRTAGLDVVERSELLEAMVRAGVRSIDRLDTPTLARVGRAIGARYVAMGSVDLLSDDTAYGARRMPEVEASTWIVDLADGSVVAAISLRRRGDYDHRGLGLGIVRDVLALADVTAGSMVAGLLEPES